MDVAILADALPRAGEEPSRLSGSCNNEFRRSRARKGRYELTRTTANEVYVRYLPPGKKLPVPGKELVVATYPFAGALAALEATDAQSLTVAGGKGGIAVVERGRPTNVRVAFPGVDFQIEVYDPSAKDARTLPHRLPSSLCRDLRRVRDADAL